MKVRQAMALLSTLVKAIAEVQGLDETTVAWIARQLREAGLISQAGRGRGAAHMNVGDAANLLIGVNALGPAKSIAETVRTFRDLKFVVDHGGDHKADAVLDERKRTEAYQRTLGFSLASGDAFGEALEKLVSAFKSAPTLGVDITLITPACVAGVFVEQDEDTYPHLNCWFSNRPAEEFTDEVFERDKWIFDGLPDRDQRSTFTDRTIRRVAETLSA